MMNKFRILTITLVSIMLTFGTFPPFDVLATELVISENGADTESTVNVSSETTTEISQNNTAGITNNIDTQTNTGNNSASLNTQADVNMATGDTTTAISVENSANTSTANLDCCNSNNDINSLITDNGSGSTNEVNIDINTSTTYVGEQTVRINNNIAGTSSTGNNSANYNNGGSVSIVTGDIKVRLNLVNAPLNLSNVDLDVSSPSVLATIAGNGAYSANIINFSNSDDRQVFTHSSADIGNYIFWDLDTGHNEANGNNGGEVTIETGDIDLEVFIKNLVNLSNVKVTCYGEDKTIDPPANDNNPTEEEKNVGGNGGGSGGQLLPAAAATEAGGPGISGLSDTSSGEAQTLFFWLALIMITIGGKIIVDEAFPGKFAASAKNRVE